MKENLLKLCDDKIEGVVIKMSIFLDQIKSIENEEEFREKLRKILKNNSNQNV